MNTTTTPDNQPASSEAERKAEFAAPSGSANLTFDQTFSALESFPGGKDFTIACRVLAGEIARAQNWEVSEWALRVARAQFVTRKDRQGIYV